MTAARVGVRIPRCTGSGRTGTPPTLLAERLRKLREDAYPRQRDFSAVIGIASSRISDWELGIHEPSLGSLRKYAAAFGMTVAQLLDGVM